MKQLGNLAIVAANHKECLLQIHDEEVTVHVGQPSERKSITCNVWDDAYIDKIIAYLNYGTEIKRGEATSQKEMHAVLPETDNPCIYIFVKDGLVQEIYGGFEPDQITIEVIDQDNNELSDEEIAEMKQRCDKIRNSYPALY